MLQMNDDGIPTTKSTIYHKQTASDFVYISVVYKSHCVCFVCLVPKTESAIYSTRTKKYRIHEKRYAKKKYNPLHQWKDLCENKIKMITAKNKFTFIDDR